MYLKSTSKRRQSRRIYTSLFCSAFISLTSAAVEPSGYYSPCENKSGAILLKALNEKIGPHNVVGYNELWELYLTSDVYPDGRIWDMYSTKAWTPTKEKCGNYKLVGDCYNREHSMPKSWFNDAVPMYSDAFHLYPTDGKVNGQRSNFPYGECSAGVTLPSNGDVQALGKLGTSTFKGYSGKVFEPADEYKGDLARSYFYMAAAYNDRIAGWDSDMLAGNPYPAFTDWAMELLLKWHRQDPVSQKELDRNEAVYAAQDNRNPFIDHPEMAEYIWGSKQTEPWSLNVGPQPAINVPADGSTFNIGAVGVGVERAVSLNVKSQDLREDIAVSINGNGWSVSPAHVSSSGANSVNGSTITVTLKAQTEGQQTSTLTLRSGNVTSTATLVANALTGIPAGEATAVSDRSFIAHWTYIGQEDADGCYMLVVTDASGEAVDTYPRSVKATDEACLVDELEPETTYLYHLESAGLKSNTVRVSTSAPIPSVSVLYDGELDLFSTPEVPGDPVELFLDIENIESDIVFEIDSPFQLSTDRETWTNRLTVDAREDRLYLRINSALPGSFASSIRVTAGDYFNDEAHVTGRVAEETNFTETFENPDGVNNTYAKSPFEFSGVSAKWILTGTGAFKIASEAHDGQCYIRFDKSGVRTVELAESRPDGIGRVSLWAAAWSAKDGAVTFDVESSADNGETWQSAGTAEIEKPSGSDKVYQQFFFTVNRPGSTKIRIRQTAGQRWCLDDVSLTSYRAGVEGVFGDERGTGWDARTVNGRLIIDLEKEAHTAVYSVEGKTRLSAVLPAGSSAFDLEPGLYIVAVGKSTRRVLVK